ncbi:MAG: FAD-dependent oxidoreductase [Kofleriaceae bacterium]
MDVTVVGAGVIGLVTAHVLELRGHRVRVVAAGTGDATTSSIAAAIWFPYRAGPIDKVLRWAATTRGWLEALAGDRDAGIDLVTGYEITPDAATAPAPWWTADLAVARAPAPVTGSPIAWRYRVPRIEPARFLGYLATRLATPIERRVVRALAAEPGDAVIDCTGLRARELARDPALVPLFGQVVMTAPGGCDLAMSITDEHDPESLFYLIPRRDQLVLGGCARPWQPGTEPEIDPALTARIVAQAAALGLPVGAVTSVRAGLRPARPSVRLERDPQEARVIHTYGHGGAGFTLCRGCADEVASLLATG